MTAEQVTPRNDVETDKMSVLSVNVSTSPGNASKGNSSAAPATPAQQTGASDVVSQDAELPQQVKRHCRPKMMPVTMPAPLGPKLFILGEPVLHRYYTVYDWSAPRIGFGLAASQRNLQGPPGSRPDADRRGSLPEGVDTILMQERLHVATMDSTSLSGSDSLAGSYGWTDDESDATLFAQVTVKVIVAMVPGKAC